ncbi:hypothetical protein HN832_01685 [archaeon]|jgi:hypothetical protein|nr:hypothetical protein [archaeon]MBT4373067.1 hypothetical protein [archaeon]MBT4531412.1 hypothetical protein [archaeon]MBT7001410.1 hypothetical protein [archaeon]MBT7282104.1 hypothetical protein [archaeon]
MLTGKSIIKIGEQKLERSKHHPKGEREGRSIRIVMVREQNPATGQYRYVARDPTKDYSEKSF